MYLATKLLRTYTMQVEALQHYRGKGQQKIRVEHVHVHSGGQAIVGAIHGVGCLETTRNKPVHQAPSRMNQGSQCGARTRSGKPCRSPVVRESAAVGCMAAPLEAARHRATAMRSRMAYIPRKLSRRGKRFEPC